MSSRSAPVAVSQESMLWHERFAPGSFNLPCLVRRYEGPLDVPALRGALSELVNRHEPLRSTFVIDGGAPRQVVRDPGLHDLPVLAVEDIDIAAFLADASRRPFDLAEGPLFEPTLVRRGENDHLLVIRLHHTVFDDWSVGPFRRELSALYTASLGRTAPALPELTTTFSEYCREERAVLDGEAGAAQREWWRQELAGAPLSVQLPIGGDGPPQPGEPVTVNLPPDLAADVRALARRLRATPFMTVLAAFTVLVARRTERDDVLIATVVAHRNRLDLEPLIGCFTKKVPLWVRLHGEPPFTEVVARTRAALLGALEHQDVAFEAALDALARPAAEHGVVPQVSVVFQAETPPVAPLSLPGLKVDPYDVPVEARQERHFAAGLRGPNAAAARTERWGDGLYLGTFLILSLRDAPEGMALIARGVFDRPAGRRLVQEFVDLLTELVAAPESTIPGASRPADDEMLDVLGFRVPRSSTEAALATCPGVADVHVAVHDNRLVAYVVPDGPARPNLTELRQALWARRPGALWPAAAILGEQWAPAPPERAALDLAERWSNVVGRERDVDDRYWQDFSFLRALDGIPDEAVVRNRTVRTLAAALG
ncbi:MAG: condensation domain-containing protein [Acidimicrobiales bacterium]